MRRINQSVRISIAAIIVLTLLFAITACTETNSQLRTENEQPVTEIPATSDSPPATDTNSQLGTENEEQITETIPPSPQSLDPSSLIHPKDFQYLGAFRLPGGDERPLTFAYGGNAMTFNPNGDASGAEDGFPGSLFITGHERLAYGELPDGGQIAEINIPQPLVSDSISDLNQGEFVQDFHDALAGYFHDMEELPRIGLEYVDNPATGPLLHVAWGQHFEPESPTGTHAWLSPNLAEPNVQGTWFIGDQSFYSVNGYLFEIPAEWAAQWTNGRSLATGRYRDGGWSGMGPALYAYQPWQEDGSPAVPDTHLQEVTLLQYESSENTVDIERNLTGYQHPDEWEGGAWLTTDSGKTAVLFAGTKATGDKYWYGFINPQNPNEPCVAGAFVGQFPVCRLADGTPCPESDLTECDGHNDFRGWWSSHFDAQFILYNPDDLAQVAAGTIEPWQPQPYVAIDIDEHLYHNPSGTEEAMIGAGDQRTHRIGAVAFDRNNGLLYVLELFADEAKPIVHVWQIE